MSETEAWRELYRGERVAVLGASGFIGRAVVQALGDCGADVFALVRDPARAGTDRVLSHPVQLLECDVLDTETLASRLESIRPAVTFNLAGYGVRPGEEDDTLASRINAELPARLPSLVSEARNPDWQGNALVHAGTQAEYGPVDMMDESVGGQPVTLYGRTKLEGTVGLADAARAAGVPAVVARIFNVYGRGERPPRLIPMLISRAGDSEPIELTAGTQKRDYAWVGDVAEGLLRLGAARQLAGEPVNLATGQPIPVKTLVLAAAQQLHISLSRLRFGALPDRGTEVPSPAVSTRRLKELTGWLPSTSLEAGISRTVANEPQSFPQSNSE